ncbi:MAG: AAA family ATPase [Bacillales bacterium]|nr:AAA family ATPase [Bacillales bacterium]
MIIGRKEEIRDLKNYYESNKAEFIVVFGRRRVGKTFLIREYFKDELFFFCSTTEKDNLQTQYIKFSKSLGIDTVISSWVEGFSILEKIIKETDLTKKKVIFIDEIPWFSKKSKLFMSFLDNFWNTFAAFREDVLFIVSGSAGNFMNDEILNSTGGLYNRKTGIIYLRPFSLRECDDLLKSKGLELSQMEVLDSYMIFGGIPYYYSFFKKGYSVVQNVDMLFFSFSGALKDEYDTIFTSLFKNSELYKNIIELLGNKDMGYSREEIVEKLKTYETGKITKYLKNLISCGFIQKYSCFPNYKKKSVYQLTDNFCYFYIKNIKDKNINDSHYWANQSEKGQYNAWRGYAFERVCYNHFEQIRTKLGISGVSNMFANWRSKEAQIDLLISRADKIIDLIEIKYCNQVYEIDRNDFDKLHNKKNSFREVTKINKTVHKVLITPLGVLVNRFYNVIDFVITLEDLFVY